MIETDALIIGAGPVGLFQVFELGLLEIGAQVVDALPRVGGQCIELYADKPIYDIPALPACTGRELIERLQQQIRPFGAVFHLGQEVSTLRRRDDERFDVATSAGTRFIARTVIIATGVGAFQPRKLKLPGLEAHEVSQQVRYRVDDPAQLAGQRIVVHGDEDAALDAALQCAAPGPHQAASVALLHRRNAFRATPDRVAALHAACEAGRIELLIGQATGFDTAPDGRLQALHLTDPEGRTRPVPLDTLWVLLGLAPKLGPVAEWGLALERRQLAVDTERFATSEPGIFAVGDAITYPGKKKLILSGFHEATLAAFAVAAHVFPGAPVQLQYTTASPRLHALLGVDHASPPAIGNGP